MKNSISGPLASSKNSPAFTASSTVGPDGEFDPKSLQKLAELEQNDALIAWIKKEYRKCKDQLEPLKRQWYLNMSFYKGDQYVDFVQGRLMKIPAPATRTRLVINRVRPYVRSQMSRLTSQEPSASVVPATNDDEDVLAAQAAESVFESLRNDLNLQGVLTEACFWSTVTGTAFIKTSWDKSYEGTDAKGNLQAGQHCYKALTPFHVLIPNLLETDIEKQPYVMNVFTMPMEQVKAKWGDIFPKDYKPKVTGTQEIMESQYLNIRSAAETAQKPDSCLILEVWVKPGNCPLMPKGGLITLVDDVIVQMNNNGIPYSHGEYPFAKLEDVPSGTFYATSGIEDIIPLQRELNRNRSQQVEARNLTSKPGFFYVEGSMDPNKWTSAPGQAIGIKPGATPPTPIPLPNLPSYVAAEHENLKADIEDVSGQHQVTNGSAPSGVTAGTAIQFLQEADNTFMAITHASVETMIKKIAKQTIALAIQYWDSQRLIKYTGRDGSISSKYLMGSDMKSGTDVRIEGGSSLPYSKAGRIALFMDLMRSGAVQPQQALEMMGLPSMRSYWDIAKVDENQALRENLEMSQLPPDGVANVRQQVQAQVQQLSGGMDPTMNPMMGGLDAMANEPVMPVHDWDNHDVHIEVHGRFMKGQGFEMLDPSIQKEFELHLQAHKDKQMQGKLQEMMGQMGGQQPGGPPQPGNPQGSPAQPGQPPNAAGNNQFSDLNKPVDAGAGQ